VPETGIVAMSRPHSKEVWIAINTAWNIVNFRSTLVSALQQAGFGVAAYAPPDRYSARFESMGARYVPMSLENARTNPFLELVTLVRMAILLGRERPAVLLTFTPKVNIYLALAARLWRVPVVANVSGLGRTFIAGGWLTWVTRILYRAAFAWPHKIYFQNAEDKAEFIAARLVRADRAELLPGSGVDVGHFSPRSTSRPEGRFIFLMAARLLWDKGVAEYVAAARMLRAEFPHARFRLVGFLDVPSPSAVPRSAVEAWQREGILEYLGHSDDMAPLYADADCVVLPSYREGMPRALLEAAAMALPVCATDVPGCRQAVLDEKTGFLCAPRDPDSLATAMRRILRMTKDERSAMGLAARERVVREFDEQIVIGRYLDAVRECVSSAPA
jgi:glycosyltransferase involved in cell wall biosynthesis